MHPHISSIPCLSHHLGLYPSTVFGYDAGFGGQTTVNLPKGKTTLTAEYRILQIWIDGTVVY